MAFLEPGLEISIHSSFVVNAPDLFCQIPEQVINVYFVCVFVLLKNKAIILIRSLIPCDSVNVIFPKGLVYACVRKRFSI